jgi:hypothetical protein
MTAQPLSLPKANSVVVLRTPEGMASHIQALKDSENKTHASIVFISCYNCTKDMSKSIDACIITNLLENIMLRTRTGCINIPAWFKYRESNAQFANVVRLLSEEKNSDQVISFVAHRKSSIKSQIQKLIEIEKTEFALVVISDFQEVPIEEQPNLASIVHKLVKGTLMYLRILSIGEPVVFRKDSFGEVGIQKNQDYLEVREG